MVGRRVVGTLLCHAGSHRVAFAAEEVSVIEAASAWADRCQPAHRAFGEAAQASRVLVSPSGEAVGVDTLEIETESLYVLPLPPVLQHVAAGSLLGFILARGEFWPLVRLVEFARYLGDQAPRRAA